MDYGRAAELDKGPGRNLSRLQRADCLARAGDLARAGAELAETLQQASKPTAVFLYDAACVHGMLAGKEKDSGRAETHAARAVALLRQAIAAGYKAAAHMKKDPDLDPRRPRADFKPLLADRHPKAQ